MATATSPAKPSADTQSSARAWRGFTDGWWQKHVDVREFIQKNYTPYEGDERFLSGPTARTRKLWEKLLPMLEEERKKGVLDVSQAPSGILAHAPGYIDKDSEIIVGLQTDAPMKRALMRARRLARVVEASLKSYNFEPDPKVAEIFSNYRKTHNDGVFDAYTPTSRSAVAHTSSPDYRTTTAAAASSATIAGWPCTGRHSSSRKSSATRPSSTTATRPRR